MSNIKSMTGYGKAIGQTAEKRITVEIKSLNSKQLDLNVKLPSLYREKEFEIRSRIAKAVIRGKVDVYISTESVGGKKAAPINLSACQGYIEQLRKLGIDENHADYLQTIISLPDVLQTEKEEVTEAEWNTLLRTIDEALDQFDRFRVQEGKTMLGDLLKRVEIIEKLKTDLNRYDKERIETIRTRIRENIEKLGIDSIDNNRFEQELIYYIEKLDINEEKVRLQNHLDYFRSVCAEESEAGRKLGFIAQEMGREINTTGSKSNNAEMQKLVVGMKDELEKIKEQSLNIL